MDVLGVDVTVVVGLVVELVVPVDVTVDVGVDETVDVAVLVRVEVIVLVAEEVMVVVGVVISQSPNVPSKNELTASLIAPAVSPQLTLSVMYPPNAHVIFTVSVPRECSTTSAASVSLTVSQLLTSLIGEKSDSLLSGSQTALERNPFPRQALTSWFTAGSCPAQLELA